MAPMILASEAMKPSMPAWKRLGLKLKSAQQESAPYATPIVVTAVATQPIHVKRKREIKDQETPLIKRVKVNRPSKAHEPKADTTPYRSPITSAQKRRKSVTFAPETKVEDGDSIKELHNGWIAKHPTQSQNRHDLRSNSSTKDSEPMQTGENIDLAIDQILQEVEAANRPKQEKRSKKVKSPKAQQTVKSIKQQDSALSYLQLFHSSKDTWKFNKNHQITLLKNAFNVEKIPSQYIEIFYSYIAGLKGSARTHLRDAAIAIKIGAQKKSVGGLAKEMSNSTAKAEMEDIPEEDFVIEAPDSASKIGYEERVLQPLSDLTIKQRIAKRMRAERILDDLAQEAQDSGKEQNGGPESNKEVEEEDRESQKRLKMSDGSVQKIRRKRKQRTNAVNESSSSDSIDSDSSSEEDDEEVPESAEDESSSSSSSSSSASDGEDEESESSESGSGSGESD